MPIVFNLRLTPQPGCDDPVRQLRGALKVLGRRFKLRCVSATEEHSEIPASAGVEPGVPGTKGTKEPHVL